jgi:uncharacterized protein YegJ (DUF2314 family)
MKTALVLAAVALIVLSVWWRFFRVARPAFPPLQIDDDDPLMAEAFQRARTTLDRFRTLCAEPHRIARCKVPFVSNAGVREYLWATVRELRTSEVEVLYTTPPVTHTGRLERVHTHPVADIVDWQVELPDGRYAGGYTVRAMFVCGREQWGSLPPALEAEETKYL